MDGLSFLDRQLKLDSQADAKSVAEDIENCQLLHFLELRGNTIGVGAGERIAQALRMHPELKRALWADIFTGRLKTEIPPILKSLCAAMTQAGTLLTELDLSDNAFGPIGAQGIEEFLSSESAFELRALRLNNNGLGGGGVTIANALLACNRLAKERGRTLPLRTFVAGRNRLEDPGAKALAKAFSELRTLEEIVIPQNGIRADGVAAMADAFGHNPNLRIININDNTCTKRGAIAIAQTLGGLDKLEVLDLGDCLCRTTGSKRIFDVLKQNAFVALREVNLSGNELSASIVMDVVKNWRTSATLNLANNCLGEAFGDVLERIEQEGLEGTIDLGDESDDEGSAEEADDDEGQEEGSAEEEKGEVAENEKEGEKQEELENKLPEVKRLGAGDAPAAASPDNMTTTTVARLVEELSQWRRDHPSGFLAKPTTGPKGAPFLFAWDVMIPGKKGTVCENGMYRMKLSFEHDYPKSAPTCIFDPPLFHPNVFPTGKMCMALLDESKDWKPAMTIKEMLLAIQEVLSDPDPNIPAQAEAHNIFMHNRPEYDRRVRSHAAMFMEELILRQAAQL